VGRQLPGTTLSPEADAIIQHIPNREKKILRKNNGAALVKKGLHPAGY
jgi:hypothetical protein